MNIVKYYAAFLKYLTAFAVGFACSTLMFVVSVLPGEAKNKFEFGTHQGFADGLGKAASMIEKEFGVYDGHTPCKTVFAFKTTHVVSIEIDGVKTIRVGE